jgi:hypothetical protein
MRIHALYALDRRHDEGPGLLDYSGVIWSDVANRSKRTRGTQLACLILLLLVRFAFQLANGAAAQAGTTLFCNGAVQELNGAQTEHNF